jgi:putative oxidoreductase
MTERNIAEPAEETPPAEAQHAPEEDPRELKFKNSWKDWALRSVIFVVYLFFASGKFKAAENAPWVVLFKQIGFGQWFRYFTAMVEIAGALLVLFSRTVELGLAVLGSVMLAAILIDLLVLHRLGDAFIPFALLCAMVAFWLHRRRV